MKDNDIYKNILESIKHSIKLSKARLHEPAFVSNENRYLTECLDTNYVSSVGKFVEKFSSMLSSYTKAKYVIPVVNGTSGLHLSLLVAGVKSNEEVLIPSLSFVATANAVCYIGAIPHFVDIEKKTLGLSPDFISDYLNEISVKKNNQLINKKTNRVIKAIIPMHTFGHPSRIDMLCGIAKEFGLILIEDAAESLGSFFKNKHTGTFGLAGVLSFNGNKIITTGGGGAILTNNKNFANKALHLSTTAKKNHNWDYIHDQVGYNYRMPNLNAALGCAQLETLDSFLAKKRTLFSSYKTNFKKIQHAKIFEEPENCKSNYWLNTLLIDSKKIDKKKLLSLSNSNDINIRPAWRLLHKLKPFKKFPKSSLAVSQKLENEIINLPSSSFLVK